MKSKHMMLTGIAVGLSTFSTTAMAQMAEGYAGHHPMWGHGGHGGGHIWFGIIGVIVLVLIVMAVVRMIGCAAGHRCGHRRGGSNAVAVLEERFAKGEIDKAEFEERKNTLTS